MIHHHIKAQSSLVTKFAKEPSIHNRDAVSKLVQDAVNAAGRATLLQGYDAIAFLPLDNGACPLIKDAVKAKDPIELIVKAGDHYRVVRVDYHGGERYPHLERNSQPDLLSDILKPHATQ